MSGLQEQLDATLAELAEADEEILKLRSQLALRPLDHLTFFSVIHVQPRDVVVVFPVADDLVGKAYLAQLLRRAADKVLEGVR